MRVSAEEEREWVTGETRMIEDTLTKDRSCSSMPVMPSMPAVSPVSLVAAERPSATVKEKDCILRAVADGE